jgi:hypothetical protein
MSNILTLESLGRALQDTPKLQVAAVSVPEFGPAAIAYVAELSSDERDERLEIAWRKHQENRANASQVGFRAWAAAACWCNADRVFVCQDGKAIADAAAKLGGADSKPVTRMFAKVADLNALGEDQVAELEKN